MPVVIVMQSTQDSLPELPQLSSMVWRQRSCVDVTAMAQRGNWGEGVSSSRSPYFQPNDLAVRSVAADPGVHEEPPIEGFFASDTSTRQWKAWTCSTQWEQWENRSISSESNLVAELHFSSAGKLNGREAENQRGDQRNKWHERRWRFSPSWTWRTWKAGGRDDGSQGLWMLRGACWSTMAMRRLPCSLASWVQRWEHACRDQLWEGSALRRLWPNGGVRSRLLGLGPLRTWKRWLPTRWTRWNWWWGHGVLSGAWHQRSGSLVRGWIPIGGFNANFSQWKFSLWNGSKKENTMAEHTACGTCAIVMVDETSTSRRGEHISAFCSCVRRHVSHAFVHISQHKSNSVYQDQFWGAFGSRTVRKKTIVSQRDGSLRVSSPLKPRNLTLTNIKTCRFCRVRYSGIRQQGNVSWILGLALFIIVLQNCGQRVFDRTSLNQDVPGGHFLIGLIRAERFLAATLVLAWKSIFLCVAKRSLVARLTYAGIVSALRFDVVALRADTWWVFFHRF